MRGVALFLLLLVAAAASTAAVAAEVVRIEIRKSERQMILLGADDSEVRTYKVALGGNPVGHKQREGDERTPEGNYLIDWRNPKSAYHLSLHVSYPDAADRAAARSRGEDPGGMIMIHGLPRRMGWIGSMHTALDWTNGCIAVTNAEIEEIWSLVADGTPVRILP
ncbi:L,D-transpeptidase-like protein [Breoghania corrubedonensis]|uniref:L,D-transpeptidase-like protein n=1 Tax=Breoghania corrubedonensis TaxID=665038 RepID=A0A2T5VEU5_9HYPH|nr:L,D-transpeptidase family protein [Breoghania corrubedonensis]PTW62260.1 L,D-transpeptidase-like protein [Breoghania corrubedonensis]